MANEAESADTEPAPETLRALMQEERQEIRHWQANAVSSTFWINGAIFAFAAAFLGATSNESPASPLFAFITVSAIATLAGFAVFILSFFKESIDLSRRSLLIRQRALGLFCEKSGETRPDKDPFPPKFITGFIIFTVGISTFLILFVVCKGFFPCPCPCMR